jgi:RND family efflux transporter MFP subunit
MRKREFLLIGGILVILASGILYFWLLAPRIVVVTNPRLGPAVQAVYATGTVEPVIMMPIAPRVGARLVQLTVDEGAVVRAGQVLARLESDDARNNLAQLAAQEDFAHRDYLRDVNLMKDGVIARQTFDKAKSTWDAARAAVAVARAQNGYMTLLAPTDGRIIRRDGEIGQFLPVNQPLFWLSCLSPLRITADVDEEDIPLVKVGQKVLVRADALPGRTFTGHVQAITPKGDPIARSYRVRISMDGGTPLQIGMTAETNIVTYEKRRALLLPSSAVTSGAVWTVRDDRLHLQPVAIGIRGANEVEIVHGVSQGEQIVVTPDASLVDGARVRMARTQGPQ